MLRIELNNDELIFKGNANDVDFTMKGLQFKSEENIIAVFDKSTGILLSKNSVMDKNDSIEMKWNHKVKKIIQTKNLIQL